jgi:uncharacterized protein (TIGR02145 family)
MKKLYTFLMAMLIALTLWAQAPQKISYQAVIRNANNELVTSKEIGMRIIILQGSADGIAVYTESFNPTTNTNGLVSVEFGGGAGFDAIDWANGPYFIKTETDPTGGNNYTITGTTQLLSVPYALHANTADRFTGTLNETDPIFLTWDKSTGISITESQVADLKEYLTEESDPTITANFNFTGAASGDLLQFDGSKWVKLTPSYLTSFTETDPEFTAWDKSTGILITESQITDLKVYLTEEADPLFSANFDFSDAAEGDLLRFNGEKWEKFTPGYLTEFTEIDPYFTQNFDMTDATEGKTLRFDGTKFIASDQQQLSITGNMLSISDGNAVTIPSTTTSAIIPVLNSMQIASLAPETGQTVYNTTHNLFQIYTGSEWMSIPVSCWPQPTPANAGPNQYFYDGTTTSTVLEANAPDTDGGTGQWSILSGTGGSIDDISNPNATFTGQADQLYRLQWSITTTCNTSTDEVLIGFSGDDLVFDYDGNSYPIVTIGEQVWMAENLRTTTYNDGTPIAYLPANHLWLFQNSGAYTYLESEGYQYLDAYGALYNGAAVLSGNLCPTGWRVSTIDDWDQLINYVVAQGYQNHQTWNPVGAAYALRSCRQVDSPLGGECATTEHPRWDSSTNYGTDVFGFSALPSGSINISFDGVFVGLPGGHLEFWSVNQHGNDISSVVFDNAVVNNYGGGGGVLTNGLSVRCVRE